MLHGLRPGGTGPGVDGRLPARLTLLAWLRRGRLLPLRVRMRYAGLVLVRTGLRVRLLREGLAALGWVRLAGVGLTLGRRRRALRHRRGSSGAGLTGTLSLLTGCLREPVTPLLARQVRRSRVGRGGCAGLRERS